MYMIIFSGAVGVGHIIYLNNRLVVKVSYAITMNK